MKALIIVDVQNDFCPGGALPVPEGDQIVPIINELIYAGLQTKNGKFFDYIVATQDWHPVNHGSFAANHEGKVPGQLIDLDGLQQILWPAHCIQNTPGANFHKDLNTLFAKVVQKGQDPNVDSYSAFWDNGQRHKTELEEYLRSKNVDEVYVVGVALDYCCRFTATDAVKAEFKTFLIADACKAVNAITPNDGDSAIEIMREYGVQIIDSNEIFKRCK